METAVLRTPRHVLTLLMPTLEVLYSHSTLGSATSFDFFFFFTMKNEAKVLEPLIKVVAEV